MPNQKLPIERALLHVGLAILGAFALLNAWASTAQYPWSNDLWLMMIPAAIVLSGLTASVILLIVFLKRKK